MHHVVEYCYQLNGFRDPCSPIWTRRNTPVTLNHNRNHTTDLFFRYTAVGYVPGP